jgi:hypothetical protein
LNAGNKKSNNQQKDDKSMTVLGIKRPAKLVNPQAAVFN